jgi:hypothetical protein
VYERIGKGLTNNSGAERLNLEKTNPRNSESDILFPALEKYRSDHSKANLQKLCVEIMQFCREVYASTQNAEEREIYHNMVKKLNN